MEKIINFFKSLFSIEKKSEVTSAGEKCKCGESCTGGNCSRCSVIEEKVNNIPIEEAVEIKSDHVLATKKVKLLDPSKKDKTGKKKNKEDKKEESFKKNKKTRSKKKNTGDNA